MTTIEIGLGDIVQINPSDPKFGRSFMYVCSVGPDYVFGEVEVVKYGKKHTEYVQLPLTKVEWVGQAVWPLRKP